MKESRTREREPLVRLRLATKGFSILLDILYQERFWMAIAYCAVLVFCFMVYDWIC